MARNDFVLAGTRVHRATCKRLPATVKPVSLEEEPDLSDATLASCCKPKGARLYLEDAQRPQPVAETEPVAEPVAESNGDLPGISKHYWACLRAYQGSSPEKDLHDAFAALKVWRRQDESYKALPPQDTHWVTSERYAWERDFLVNFVLGRQGKSRQTVFADMVAPGAMGQKASRN